MVHRDVIQEVGKAVVVEHLFNFSLSEVLLVEQHQVVLGCFVGVVLFHLLKDLFAWKLAQQ